MMRRAVLATLCYYDVLDYPLKAEEVFNCLIKTGAAGTAAPDPMPTEEVTPLDVRRTLDQLVLERVVDFDEGFYFLAGRDYLVPLRQKKSALSARKLRRARRIVWWLQWLPFVPAVFASGSLGLGNCDELSDLDVLIVAKYGRIWTARLLVTVWLSLWGLRRWPQHRRAPDRICLNHYITDQSLAIPFHTLYNAQTYLHLKPLLVRDPAVFVNFQNKNGWVGEFLCQPWQVSYDPAVTIRPNWLARPVSRLLAWLCGDWLERWARRWQTRRIAANPLTAHPVGHVIYDDTQLSFHPDSPEGEVMLSYERKLMTVR